MKYKTLITVLFICLIVACKSEKQQLEEEITGIEKELRSDTTGIMNLQKATAAIKLYEDYSGLYPDDSLSAGYLFKAADISAHSRNITHALELFKSIIEKYPQSKYVAQSWFFIGFLNENELKNYEEARKAYITLLEKFPEYEQRETVQWLLDHLGKSDAELAKQFEAMQPADTAAVVIENKH